MIFSDSGHLKFHYLELQIDVKFGTMYQELNEKEHRVTTQSMK